MFQIALVIIAFVIAILLLSILPDFNQKMIESLPNTKPDIKNTTNKVLDFKNNVDNANDILSLFEKWFKFKL